MQSLLLACSRLPPVCSYAACLLAARCRCFACSLLLLLLPRLLLACSLFRICLLACLQPADAARSLLLPRGLLLLPCSLLLLLQLMLQSLLLLQPLLLLLLAHVPNA